jgi:hypothetical protein
MKITIVRQEQNRIDFLIEREQVMYNNVNVSATFTDDEVLGFTDNQIKTYAYNKVKNIAIRVFAQIEPLSEMDNPIGFSLVDLPMVEPNLNIIKSMQKDIISNKCNELIESGFTSTAYQGIGKTYNCRLEDQTNILGLAFAASSKMAGTPGCENDIFYYHAKGENFVEYTIAECLQLARDMKAFIEVQLFKSKLLQNYIDSLSTVDDVQAVTWSTELPTV